MKRQVNLWNRHYFQVEWQNVRSLSALLEKEENVFTLSPVCRIQADQELFKRTVHLMVEDEVRLLAWFSKLVLILKTSTRDIIANTRAYFPVKPKFFSDSFSEPTSVFLYQYFVKFSSFSVFIKTYNGNILQIICLIVEPSNYFICK